MGTHQAIKTIYMTPILRLNGGENIVNVQNVWDASSNNEIHVCTWGHTHIRHKSQEITA